MAKQANTEALAAMGRVRHIHFIGIGGAGMCGIAEVLLNLGYHISGSDIANNSVTQRLQHLGVNVMQGHKAEHIHNADVLVTSTAIKDDNPEVMAAKQARIPIVPRAQMLAEIMRFRYGIAIAGTHGKTTTTSLVASVLAEGELDPTFVIGGRLNSVGANAKLGASRYLVAEADESDASFLHLHPMMSVVTNVDTDHMGTYGNDFSQLQQTFVKFLHQLPFYGLAVLNVDDPIVRQLLPEVSRPLLTYGFHDSADIQGYDYLACGAKSQFRVKRRDQEKDLHIVLNMPGLHNVSNALAAVAIATSLNIADQAICSALANFSELLTAILILDLTLGADTEALRLRCGFDGCF